MNAEQMYCYGMMLAEQGIIEAMKAENMQREALGQSMAYTEKDFYGCINSLRELAIRAMNSY